MQQEENEGEKLNNQIKEEFIIERSAKIYKKENTFFNPAQMLNRDISLEAIKLYFEERSTFKVLLAMAASGLRGIRYLNDIDNCNVYFNDLSKEAIESIKENLILNGHNDHEIVEKINHDHNRKITILNKDCNVLMNEITRFFDVIDIDPFGSCSPFVDAAFKAVKHNGLICFTSTDKAALCSKTTKCFLKYNSVIKRNFCKNETPIRVLLSFLSREIAKYDASIEPLISFSVDYYLRVIVRVIKGKGRKAIENNSYAFICDCQNFTEVEIKNGIKFNNKSKCDFCDKERNLYGPFWNKNINDKAFISKLLNRITEKNNERTVGLLRYLEHELNTMFYYEMPVLSSILKKPAIKLHKMLTGLANKGYKASLTHGDLNSFKTNAPFNVITFLFLNIEENPDLIVKNDNVENIFKINFYKKEISSGMKPGSLPKTSKNSN
ncbi:N2N2 dimethylguanosine tRNA methylTase [Nucleospora cyclopteri]